MSKKVILGTLLASATLLGASAGHAATSDIKSESKKVTVTSDKAKLYKDSTMKESTTAKKGTVYQVDGYRDIDGKHVYRVYQTDKDNKQQYKGYIINKDTKELKSETASGQYVAKKGATLWNNFYWNSKKAVTSEEKVYFAKYSYTLGDGAKYYSVYYKDKDGKDVWAGYTNASNVKELKATEETKYVTLKKDYSTWANLYFKQHKDDFKAEKGVNFKVKRYYTLNGNKFYSTYRTDANGKDVWTGYVNGYSSVIEDLKAEKVADKDQKVQVVKDYNTYSNHFFNKKGQLSKDKIVTMKLTYTYGNGKKYASLYDGDTWLGYANVDAVKSASALLDDANKAIEDAKDKLKGNTVDSQKVINNAIKGVEDAIKSNDAAKIKDSVDKLNEAVKNAQPVATSADMERLNEAIQIAQKYVGSADHTTDHKALDEAIENAKKVQEAAKKDNASSKDVDDAIKSIDDAIKGIKPGETSANKEEVQKLKAAIKLLQDVNKIGADKLENDGNYDTVLQGAEDVLKVAEEGKAAQDQIDKAVKSIEDFINGLTLNNSELEKAIAKTKEDASNVYLTKDQEDKIDAFIKEAQEATKDNKLSNFDKLKTIHDNLDKVNKFIAGQPDKEVADKLIEQLKDVKAIEKLANKGNDLVNKEKLTEPLKEVANDFNELKKDQADNNTAKTELTKDKIEKDAKALEVAISELGLDKTDLDKVIDAAGKYDGASKDEVSKALETLKQEANDTHISNYQNIKEAAEAVYAPMEKDLKAVIDDVKPWNNNQLTNDPKVKPAELPHPLKAVAKDVKVTAIEGLTLSGQQFAKYVEENADTVADYYSDSYTQFGTDLEKAATLTGEIAKDEVQTKETEGTSASQLATNFEEVGTLVSQLPKDKNTLSFDKEKLQELVTKGQAAKDSWLNQEKKSRHDNTDAATAQAQKANVGFYQLKSWLSNASLTATKDNADTMWTKVYNAMNGYYQYIETVQWSSSSNKYEAKSSQLSSASTNKEVNNIHE